MIFKQQIVASYLSKRFYEDISTWDSGEVY